MIYKRIGLLWVGPFSNEGHIFYTDAAHSPRIVIWTDWARSGQRAIWDVGRLQLVGGMDGSQVVNILVGRLRKLQIIPDACTSNKPT